MKKEYKKPELLFDSFELSVNIAAGCSSNHRVGLSENACGLVVPGIGTAFVSEPICTYVPQEDESGWCYHVPTADTRHFGS